MLLLASTMAGCGASERAGDSQSAVGWCAKDSANCTTIVFRGGVADPSLAAAHPPTLRIPDAYIAEEFRDRISGAESVVLPSVVLTVPASACGLDAGLLDTKGVAVGLTEVSTDWSRMMMEGRRRAADDYPAQFPILTDPRSKLRYQQLESYPNWHVRRRYLNEAPQSVGFVSMECTHPAAGRKPDGIVGRCWLHTSPVEGLMTMTVFKEARLEDWGEVRRCVDDLVLRFVDDARTSPSGR
ncbi:hypothetical protein QLQ15_09365 [Lysobacter sp. LF1]|uniref:Uncharacterized protein n=1 Tax=Lysobacter stagni TaxID=3045172 RepID=A0ABT6XG40_9GAMM|nr:hypothetical protein [Lysobacter sp. LF1]MDI9239117.1 hypothetical protein [Lysobacter sp. LF1]